MSIAQYPASYETASEERLPIPQAIIDLRLQYGYENVYDRFLYTAVGQVVEPGEPRTEPIPPIIEEYGWTEAEIGLFKQIMYSGYTDRGDLLHIRKREDYWLLVHGNVYTGELRLLHDLCTNEEAGEGRTATVLTHGPADPVILLTTVGEATGEATMFIGSGTSEFYNAKPLYSLATEITKFEHAKTQIFAEVSGAIALAEVVELKPLQEL